MKLMSAIKCQPHKQTPHTDIYIVEGFQLRKNSFLLPRGKSNVHAVTNRSLGKKRPLPNFSPAPELTPALGINVLPLATLPHHSLAAVGGGGTEDWLYPKALLPIPIEPKFTAETEERSPTVTEGLSLESQNSYSQPYTVGHAQA